MAWLESHQGLARHIKTKRLSRKLNVSVPAIIGHLHLLWWWAMDNLPDGCLSLLEPEDIADEMMWEGDAQELLSSLIEVGFIDKIDNQLFIHDWHDYIGKLVDKRRTDAERKRRSRKPSVNNPKDVQRTSTGQPEDVPRDGAGNSTVPNSTVQYSTKYIDMLNDLKIECKGIHGLEKVISFVGVIDTDLIDLILNKSKGKSVAYFETIAENCIKNGITTAEQWKQVNKPQTESSRLDVIDDL